MPSLWRCASAVTVGQTSATQVAAKGLRPARRLAPTPNPRSGFSGGTPLAANLFAECLRFSSLSDSNAHAARRAFHHALGASNINRVQVFHLKFGNLAQLRAAERAYFRPVWRCRTFLNAQRLLQQISDRRGARDKSEAAIFIDRQFDGHHLPHLIGRALVVLFAEGHNVDAILADCWANGRRGRGLARLNLEPHDGSNAFCHTSLSIIRQMKASALDDARWPMPRPCRSGNRGYTPPFTI